MYIASQFSISNLKKHGYVYFQLKEMEKKMSDQRKGGGKDGKSGTKDGTYCVNDTDSVSKSFCDDTYLTRHPKSKFGVNSRLNRSYREKNLLRHNKIHSSCLEPTPSAVADPRLDDARLVEDLDVSFDECYKIPNDSLYPSSYKYIPEDALLEVPYVSPKIAVRRKDVSCMSPNTRRSKRASWHYTMFQKLSPQVPRANKETAVWRECTLKVQ